MKTKININDFILLISWLKYYFELDNKPFKYQNLSDQSDTYKLTQTAWDTKIHNIDDFMKDLFQLYIKTQEIKEQFDEAISMINSPFIKIDLMIEQTKTFLNICEDLLTNYKYDEPEIKGIQRTFLQVNNKMAECIKNEDYEGAANIRDILNS